MVDDENILLPHLSYHSVLDQIRDGIFVTDENLKIIYWNEEAQKLTGFERKEMVDTHCRDSILIVDSLKEARAIWEEDPDPLSKAMNTGLAGTFGHLLHIKNKAGGFLPVSVTVGPVHNSSGGIVGGICQFSDRSEEHRQRRLAAEIQKRMVTTGPLGRHGLLVETLYKPLEELGGDFLEAFFLNDGTLLATIADATGHGVSAALFSMIYKALMHSALAAHRSPAQILQSVNQGFCRTVNIEGFYLTGSLVYLDPGTGSGLFSAAGHPSGLLFRPESVGKGFRLQEKLTLRSPMLGVSEEAAFPELPFSLGGGEFLLLASDGLFESECQDGKPYGVEGVELFFKDYQGGQPLAALFEDVVSKSRFVSPQDDVSLLRVGRPTADP